MTSLSRTLVLLLLALPWTGASAQGYPARPIKMVVGLPAGSGLDFVSRIIAENLRDTLGQTVVVENKPGADGIIAARHVAAAAPDGYTLLEATSGQMTITPVLHTDVPYDPLRDFVPIALVARWPLALVVTPDVPANTVQELVAYAKAHPDKLNYGAASSNYMLATEMLAGLTGTQMRHIPYPSIPAVINALLAGDVQVGMVNMLSLAPSIKAGKLRALAVNSAGREPMLPGVPTLAEAGIRDYTFVMWMGMFAPAGTPPDVVARLQAAVSQALQSEDVRSRLAAAGVVPVNGSSQVLRDTIDRDTRIYSGLAKSLRTDGK